MKNTKQKLPNPIGARILIKPDEVMIGTMAVSLDTAQEVATVLAIGDKWNHEEEPLKVGDRIHVKSWAHDLVTEGENRYVYVWQKTGGVCGKIK